MSSTKIPSDMLREWQTKPLEWKVERSLLRIKQFYDKLDGKVYVSFSGGKDSTVLLNLVRSLYPEVQVVFVDTGLEFPEIKDFIKTVDNVVTIRPKMGFKEVIEKHGYPVVSKQVSMCIDRYHATKDPKMKQFRLHGVRNHGGGYHIGVIPQKWIFLVNAPFKISDKCCDVMKKEPLKRYQKETGLFPYIGTMASDSERRERDYLKTGCNVFNKHPSSRPMGFWLEDDIWAYIKKHDISYSKIYDMGEKRTGCMFCMFGCHLEGHPNRFRRMKSTHPQLWSYCMNKLGLKDVLRYVGLDSGVDLLDGYFKGEVIDG